MTQSRSEGPVTRQAILAQATEIVGGRSASYGKPEDIFDRIARFWTQHLANIGAVNGEHPGLNATDVALMMALMKIARLEANPSHHDSWVDLAGYAACGGEIAESGSGAAPAAFRDTRTFDETDIWRE